MTNQRSLTLLSLILNLALVSCSPVTTPIVKERTSKIISYNAKRFQPWTKSRVRKNTRQNDHLYFNKKGDISKEIIFGEPIGGALVENDQMVGSWSGTNYKKIGFVVYYFYENDELKKTESCRYINNKKVEDCDTVLYENGKEIRPYIEVIRNDDWEIHKGPNYVDSIKMDNKNRVLLEKHYHEGELSYVEKFEYDGPTTIKNYYGIRYDGDTARSMYVTYTKNDYIENTTQTIWELKLSPSLNYATRILYVYNRHGNLSKKLYYKSNTITGKEELDYYYKYRYKYY